MTANQGIPNRKRRSREEIKRQVSEFEKSGLRPAKFCRSHGLALSILQRHLKWRRLENGQAKVWGGHNQATNNRLVAVALAGRDLEGNSRPTCALKIVLSSSRQIEVEPDFDSETLARLVRILEIDYRACLDFRPRPASTWRWERPTYASITGVRPPQRAFCPSGPASGRFRGEADMNRQARLAGSVENDPTLL